MNTKNAVLKNAQKLGRDQQRAIKGGAKNRRYCITCIGENDITTKECFNDTDPSDDQDDNCKVTYE
ncbi:hypothetical protein ACL0VS_16255 [Chryseobacterium sp. PMSZPI]